MDSDESPSTAIVLAACVLVLAPTLAYRLGVDQGVFAYMASALLRGDWPYLQTWESDFPGLMFLQAVEILLFGQSVAMFRLFDILFQLGNAYFIFRIGCRLSGRTGAMVAAVLYCLIYQGYGPWNTAQREGFGLLFILTGFWAYLTADRRRPWITAALIGLGMGLAITIKPTLLALSLFYAPLLAGLRTRQAVCVTAVGAFCLLLPAALFIAAFWAVGGLRELYEACVSYQPIYTARLRGTAPLLTYWIGKLDRLGRNAVLVSILSMPFLFHGAARRERLMVWLALVGSVYSVLVQGTFAGYHYLPGMAVGAILVGDMFSTVSGWGLPRLNRAMAIGRPVTPLLLAIVLLAAAAPFYMLKARITNLISLQFLRPPAVNEFRNGTVFDFTESYNVASYLRERTAEDQPIQVWGYESLVYYLADRPAASRFQMTHPLVMRVPGGDLTPMQRRWRAEFVADIERRRPAYVAVVRQDHWWWAPGEQTSEELLDDFSQWKGIINRDYALETTIGRFLIYRRTQS